LPKLKNVSNIFQSILKSVKIYTNYKTFCHFFCYINACYKKYKLQTFCHYLCYINACYNKNVSKSVEISCLLPVHLFDKSDTFVERKEKTVQSLNRLTTDNWFFGRRHFGNGVLTNLNNGSLLYLK
jgi:hypothetical protein